MADVEALRAWLDSPPAWLADAADTWVEVVGAGHLAYSDLCGLDLGVVAEDVLVGRDDLNTVLVDSLVTLGTDGCAGYTPTVPDCGPTSTPEEADEALRGATSAFLEGAVGGEARPRWRSHVGRGSPRVRALGRTHAGPARSCSSRPSRWAPDG